MVLIKNSHVKRIIRCTLGTSGGDKNLKFLVTPNMYSYPLHMCKRDLTLEKAFLLYLEPKLRDLNLDFHIALTLNERVDICIYHSSD